MQAALDTHVRRVIHTSSIAALGVPSSDPTGNGTRPLVNESHTWNYDAAKWPYAAAKYQAELEVQKAVAKGLDAVVVNPAYVLGAGDVYQHSGSIVMMISSGKIPVMLHGGLNIVHIDDVIEGHLAAVERAIRGERYILGGENMTVQEFVRLTSRVAGVVPPSITIPVRVVQAAPVILKLLRSVWDLTISDEVLLLSGRYFYLDITKSQQKLGLSAPRTAESAIREAYQWFAVQKAV
jgi:dihydroflavonol-4-reductase